MKTFLNRHIAVLLVLAFVIAAPVLPCRVRADDAPKPIKSTGKSMMWKVSSDTATVYLVGSMHLATPEMYPLPKEMEEAFAKSDILVVEVNINKLDQQKVLAIIQDKGMYKGAETLSKSIKKETYDQVKDVCQNLGFPVIAIEKMKPWILGVTIEELEVQKLGLDPKLGIDQHFLGLAEKNSKTIEELETAEFQLNLLASFDAATQEKNLAATLDEVKDMKQDIDKLKAAWMAGDSEALYAVMTENSKRHPEVDDVMQKVIFDRNGPMADKVKGYLKGTKTVYVIAGALHMVGDKGVVELLRKDNLKVEQSPATRAAKPAN